MAASTVYLINASGGEPDKAAPDSGEVIQMPQIVSHPERRPWRRSSQAT